MIQALLALQSRHRAPWSSQRFMVSVTGRAQAAASLAGSSDYAFRDLLRRGQGTAAVMNDDEVMIFSARRAAPHREMALCTAADDALRAC